MTYERLPFSCYVVHRRGMTPVMKIASSRPPLVGVLMPKE
jgi:hypothetical protein